MIHPFRALRYEPAKVGGLHQVITQPYDKITPQMKAEYVLRSPYSTVHLIRGEQGPDDAEWYSAVRPKVESWIRDGVLIRDSSPAYFLYEQTFLDSQGESRTRRAITGLVDLRERQRVFHHERTHAGPRRDRKKLLDTAGLHFGQIFLLRSEGPKIPSEIGMDVLELGNFRDEEGVHHRFSALRGDTVNRHLQSIFADSKFVIADGHHRWTVACQYADENPHLAGAAFAIAGVVEVEDPGLVVLPTHRILRSLPVERRNGLEPFVQRLGGRAVPFLGSHEALLQGVERAGPGTIGLAFKRAGFLLTWPSDTPEGPVESLDVHRLDKYITGPLLQGLPVEQHLDYRRHGRDALRALDENADMVILLNPVDARTVVTVASNGGVMPQKSTDFFPKLLSGWVFYDTRL